MELKITGNITPAEAEVYKDYLEKKHGAVVKHLEVEEDGDYVNLNYILEAAPFERIRRITGYLVGSMDHWNDAKKAEEKDRVKHGLSQLETLEDEENEEPDIPVTEVPGCGYHAHEDPDMIDFDELGLS